MKTNEWVLVRLELILRLQYLFICLVMCLEYNLVTKFISRQH